LGARSKTGKTSFAIDLSANLNLSGIPVYWASIEMMKEELGQKYLARLSEVPINDIRKGELDYYEWRKVLSTHKKFCDMPLYVDDETSDLDRLVDILGGLVAKHGPGLVILDYIELVSKLSGESDFGLTGRVVVELKALAKILKVPIMALSNFNRKAEQDIVEDADPMDGWLRNNGLVEQTADVILYIIGNQGEGILERRMVLQKERHSGTSGKEFTLWYDGSISRFYSQPPARVARDLNLGNLGELRLV
jgi:replicative DNA helicase